MIRQRKKISLDTVRELDTFPKLPETFVETSRVGGTFSVITCGIIAWLIYSEISYYVQSRFMFKFEPDMDYEAKLKIHIDITVAMPCHSVGADILDSTNQNVFAFGTLEEEDTWFELSQEQREYFNNMQYINSYLREEFHAIQDLLWKFGESSHFGRLPERKYKPVTEPDACRIYGSLVLNKVAGNFHITAGKSLTLPQGHVHISAFMDSNYNFSHRIHRLAFGEPSPGIIHPLEGDEKVTQDRMVLYNYFIEVVPTDVRTFMSRSYTYQYSVKDHQRLVDHQKGSHGIAGIFFKYDMSALKVLVTEEREPLDQFVVRICATVGGIFVTAGFINSGVQSFMKLWDRCTKSKSKQSHHIDNPIATSSTTLLQRGDNETKNSIVSTIIPADL